MTWSTRTLGLLVAVGTSIGILGAPAAGAAPVLEVSSHHAPTVMQPGSIGSYTFAVQNVGDAPTSGTVSLQIDLSAGLTTRLDGPLTPPFPGDSVAGRLTGNGWDCPTHASSGETAVSCTLIASSLPPGQTEPLTVFTAVGSTPPASLSVAASVTGAGFSPAHVTETASIGAPASSFGIAPGTFAADAFDATGRPERQAGGHPWRATAAFDSVTRTDTVPDLLGNPKAVIAPIGTLRDLLVTLPRGFVGNPRAVAQCTPVALMAAQSDVGSPCPVDSQIGTVDFMLQTVLGVKSPPAFNHAPIYNMVPPKGELAAFGFHLLGHPVYIIASLDPRDHSVRTRASYLNETLPVHFQKLSLWGVPADPAHDADRWNPQLNGGAGGFGGQSSAPLRPFLTLPSACGVGDTTDLSEVDSWQSPGAFLPTLSTPTVQVTGCDGLSFTPSASIQATASRPDASTGLAVDMDLPQDDNAVGLGTPPLKRAVVTLPEGMSINSAAADGLQACSDAQLGLGTDRKVSCPDAAKIGTVMAESPAVEGPIAGSLYLRSQASDDPESGEMFRLALVIENDERGLLVKLPGSARVNRVTGQVVTTFDDNPQLPVSKISLRLKSGSRAPLSTPANCGAAAIDAQLTSWNDHVADLASPVRFDCPGLQRLAPSFTAGVTDPAAGQHAGFALRVERPDGQQYLNNLSMQLPPGALATLKGVPQCTADRAEAGTCGEASRVGTATVGVGTGTNPFFVRGGVYLTGPYKGAPFGLAVKVRAVAGPFDLGTVVVRQQLLVDPIDAHATVVSDPLPTVLKGVPIRLRSLNVDVDRPGFVLNGTACAKQQVTAQLGAVDGTAFDASSPFGLTGCQRLGLKPRLDLSLSGKGQTTDGKHPAVSATLIQPQGGQANLKKVRVALPLSLALDPDNANGLCEFVDGSKVTPTCPKASIVGSATAVTPILDEPLSGPVYFVKNIRKDPKSGREIRTLPKLVIPLVGQNGVKLTLTGTSDVVDDQLVTTFGNIPDAPVSSFKLSIIGGKGGILTVSGTDICKATQVADQQIDGQNTKQADADVFIQTPSCPLKVISKKVGKSSVAVKVGGLGAGKVTITGKGIKKTTKTISKSTVATITAKRTKGKPGKVTVSYDPTGPAKARKTTK